MTPPQAHTLCPNLIVIPRDPEKERMRSNELLEILQKISPLVEEESPGVFFLDTSGLGLLYKSEKGLVQKIISSIRTKLYPIKAGVAKNKFLAKVAAEISEISNYTIVTAGTEKKFLNNLSTDYLNLSEETRERLQDLGIKTIGEVADFNSNEIAQRFGKEGGVFSLHSKGDDLDLFSPENLTESLSKTTSLTYTIYKSDTIVRHIEKLMDDLFVKLKNAGHAVSAMQINLVLDDRSDKSFDVTADRPTTNLTRFLRLIRFELEKLKLSGGIIEISATIPQTYQESSEQLELPERMSAGRNNILSRNNLINVPDFKKLCLPELNDSFLPDRNFSLFPASFPTRKTKRATQRSDWRHPYSMHLISGLRLLQPPTETEVITEKGLPKAVVIGNATRKIKSRKGPWQISGGWWQENFDRLYYEIEIADSKLFLLFYNRISSRWFIHGIFD
ncbi:MAG: hypothetical protein KKG33_11785 [candidate division Zixibacteria bacterium]|nr:hypothetical protein [candidate division Zixibacteria bacterium]MBU1471389.1 hypothetical protein [candidate division Zixibacteria bacterium]MBU2626229.1 hypothetical protein [candidate division Zixibacteria bacterium]